MTEFPRLDSKSHHRQLEAFLCAKSLLYLFTMPPQIKQDLNRSGWETTDFPSVCETCLPDNPYVKMLKEDYGAECKLVSLSRRFPPRFRIETMLTCI